MARLAVLAVLTIAAVVVAALLQRRRPEAPTAPSYRAPTQVDPVDFNFNGAPKLAAVFTSATCLGCESAWAVVSGLKSSVVGVQEIQIQRSSSLHQKYNIDGVPTTLILDGEGVVLESYFGPVDSDILREVLSKPEG